MGTMAIRVPTRGGAARRCGTPQKVGGCRTIGVVGEGERAPSPMIQNGAARSVLDRSQRRERRVVPTGTRSGRPDSFRACAQRREPPCDGMRVAHGRTHEPRRGDRARTSACGPWWRPRPWAAPGRQPHAGQAHRPDGNKPCLGRPLDFRGKTGGPRPRERAIPNHLIAERPDRSVVVWVIARARTHRYRLCLPFAVHLA